MNAETPQDMRRFLLLWIGQTISLLGSGLTSFALGVWIYQQTGEATPFALTVLFGTLPRILLAPLGGSLADRRNRKQIMLLADTGNALITAAAASIALTGNLAVWNIYLLAAFGSVFAAFQEPAFGASVVMLVPQKDLGRASGLRNLAEALGGLITPLLGGLLYGLIGLGGVMIIDFATYFFALGALLATRIPQTRPLAGATCASGRDCSGCCGISRWSTSSSTSPRCCSARWCSRATRPPYWARCKWPPARACCWAAC